MTKTTTNNLVTLRSSDGEELTVTKTVAKESQVIRHLIEDDCAQNTIPLSNVTFKTLRKAIEYCKVHAPIKEVAAPPTEEEVSIVTMTEKEMEEWDKEFVKVDHGTLFQLVLVAHYLNIDGLLALTCKRVAELMIGKSPEEIREMFNIKKDYAADEEEELRRDNEWAFE